MLSSCTPLLLNLAGVAGIEPAYPGVKIPSLPTWLHPIISKYNNDKDNNLTALGTPLALTFYISYEIIVIVFVPFIPLFATDPIRYAIEI